MCVQQRADHLQHNKYHDRVKSIWNPVNGAVLATSWFIKGHWEMPEESPLSVMQMTKLWHEQVQSISKHYSQAHHSICWATTGNEMRKSEWRNVGKGCFFCCLISPWWSQHWERKANPMIWFRSSCTMDCLTEERASESLLTSFLGQKQIWNGV